MNLTRKLFYNKRNGQATLIIPAKAITELQNGSKLKISTLSFKIFKVKKEKSNGY
jgi:hypothetical protein